MWEKLKDIGAVAALAGFALSVLTGFVFLIIGTVRDSDQNAVKDGFRTAVNASWTEHSQCEFDLRMNDHHNEEQWLAGCYEGTDYRAGRR